MRWMPVWLIARDVAHERQQTGMPGAGAERAARVKAQHLVDVGRQGGKVDPAVLGQILRRQRAGDRLGLLP